MVKHIADEILLIPIGDIAKSFHGCIRINEVTELIIQKATHPTEIENLVEAIMQNYDVDREQAFNDTLEIIEMLLKLNIITQD